MTELEPLLRRLEQLTPAFGRAKDDLTALSTRARHQDYKGVLQNARLVVEMLLRSLVTTELKQTPGKAMLDELISKFRQQAHAGVIPTNILAHMGTVQAWGNLSSHDHAGGLHETGVKVGIEEAATSLNSLVAILTWYKERYVQEPVAPVPETPPVTTAATSPAPSAGTSKSRRTAFMAGGLLAVLLGGLGVLTLRSNPVPELRLRMDVISAENSEPVPPAACQEQDAAALTALLEVAPGLSDRIPEMSRAGKAAEVLETLRARGKAWRPEGWFHVARASLLAGHPDTAAMSAALECQGFAAAENLAGRMAALAQDWKESVAHYERAAALDANFWKPRFNLGLIHLQAQRAEQAVPLLEKAAELAPDVAEISLFLGHAYAARAGSAQAAGRDGEANTDRMRAKAAWCRARDRGAPQAGALCKP
ncbi:tetratricopeptide repeat protein [Hyalangium gracile]|uniref:tetratricopeptide repeat protein n=1 Tax=Hyalangium gracile TaxID=394092 RepID=UPI001CCF08FD|nr:tetratricopeptide repeat protein [Hyalangium gracile]